MSIDTERVKTYIEEHIDELRVIGDVARSLDVSEETLRKTFRRRGGMSLSAFMAATRVERAKQLLHDTDLRCFEICDRVGFTREDSGAKTFKRLAGMTMEQYRRRPARARPRPSRPGPRRASMPEKSTGNSNR